MRDSVLLYKTIAAWIKSSKYDLSVDSLMFSVSICSQNPRNPAAGRVSVVFTYIQ